VKLCEQLCWSPGRNRSRLLAETTRNARLTQIHTTDFRRTRLTGRPATDATGHTMDVYDPRDLTGALIGDLGTQIAEMEYDRLYIVTLTEDGASTMLISFGKRFGG